MRKPNSRNPWAWVPSLYFAEGIPYYAVMTVSVIMFKRLGISNTNVAFYTSLLYLPWAIKPLWSPLIDIFFTKRRWVVTMQLLISFALVGVAFAVSTSNFLLPTLLVFGIIAFGSATHDIAADGLYMLGLDQSKQAAFAGIRNMVYRIAKIVAQGALVVLAGTLEPHLGIPHAWSVTFFVIAVIFISICLYHRFILPYPAEDRSTLKAQSKGVASEFLRSFILFFKRKDIWIIILFLFFYRFAEAQLEKLIQPFLVDGYEKGGLGLATNDIGIVYGTVGAIALIAGGLLGGLVISKKGLRKWLWPMVIIMHTPDLMFIYLSQFQPTSFLIITTAVAFEQFGYGFGFTAYAMYMIYISQGEYKTSHFAICTGIMALGMMLPGMISGKIQELVGYQHFFLWVMISTIPGFIVAALVKIDPEFGKKKTEV